MGFAGMKHEMYLLPKHIYNIVEIQIKRQWQQQASLSFSRAHARQSYGISSATQSATFSARGRKKKQNTTPGLPLWDAIHGILQKS